MGDRLQKATVRGGEKELINLFSEIFILISGYEYKPGESLNLGKPLVPVFEGKAQTIYPAQSHLSI